eukprot:6878646-Lingulodinium_polyedra.AAC.1
MMRTVVRTVVWRQVRHARLRKETTERASWVGRLTGGRRPWCWDLYAVVRIVCHGFAGRRAACACVC